MKTLQHPKEDIKGVAWGVRFHPTASLSPPREGSGAASSGSRSPTRKASSSSSLSPTPPATSTCTPMGPRLATAHHDGIVRICHEGREHKPESHKISILPFV